MLRGGQHRAVRRASFTGPASGKDRRDGRSGVEVIDAFGVSGAFDDGADGPTGGRITALVFYRARTM
jgi:hypothetical protein